MSSFASCASVRWSLTTTRSPAASAAAAVHAGDLDPVVVLQAGVDVEPLGAIVDDLEDAAAGRRG